MGVVWGKGGLAKATSVPARGFIQRASVRNIRSVETEPSQNEDTEETQAYESQYRTALSSRDGKNPLAPSRGCARAALEAEVLREIYL